MPPRSTGCANCRKRKIKCDETRPSCKKCLTHNTICPGYRGLAPDGLEWRDETALVVRRVERTTKTKQLQTLTFNLNKPSPNSDSSSPSTASLFSSSNNSSSGSSSSSSSSSNENSRFSTPEAEGFISPIPMEVLSATINRAQIFDVCMRFYRPSNLTTASLTIPSAHMSDFGILQKVLCQDSKPVLLAAVDALSLVQLGVSFRDKFLWEEARKRYGVALKGLVRELGRGDVLKCNDVLAAMKLLEFCELFEPIGQQGSWLSHVDGTESFLKRRGPSPLITELDTMLFFHARHSSIVKAIPERKALFFAQPEWLEISQVTSSDPSSQLFDIVVPVPALFELADKIIASATTTSPPSSSSSPSSIPSSDSTSSSPIQTLIHALQTHLSTLESWLENWQSSMPVFPYSPIPVSHFQTFSSLVPNITFPLAFSFDNFWVGYLHSITWVYLASMQKTLLQLLALFPEQEQQQEKDTYDLSEANLSSQLLQNTINLCQMMAPFCDASSASTGKFATFMPLSFSFCVFEEKGMKEQARWCVDVTRACFGEGISPPWMPFFEQRMGKILED